MNLPTNALRQLHHVRLHMLHLIFIFHLIPDLLLHIKSYNILWRLPYRLIWSILSFLRINAHSFRILPHQYNILHLRILTKAICDLIKNPLSTIPGINSFHNHPLLYDMEIIVFYYQRLQKIEQELAFPCSLDNLLTHYFSHGIFLRRTIWLPLPHNNSIPPN